VRAPAGEDAEAIAAALRRGSVCAIPTDTVYGLAADPGRPGATEALFVLKGRPPGLALPVLVASAAQAEQLAGPAGLSPAARALADRFWPGALTIVVRRRPHLDWDLGGDPATIGLRCPGHPLARRLCRRVGPLATTSANRHGQAPLVSAEEVRAEFGDSVAVLDGGRCDGAPSTVVDVCDGPPRLLRQGGVPWDEVLGALSPSRPPPSGAAG
jgi:L-threonylcarbamoyladenylate synthase